MDPYHFIETDLFKTINNMDELPSKGATGFHLNKLYDFCQNSNGKKYKLLKSLFTISPRTFESDQEGYVYAIKNNGKVVYTYNGNAFNCIINHLSQNLCADKHVTNLVLNKLYIPSSTSTKINNKTNLKKFVNHCDFSKKWVLKPKNGAMGIDVILDISSHRKMRKFGQKLLKKWGAIIIEPQIFFTQDIRVQCIGGKYYAAIQREKANVVGDGKSTIKDLILEKNRRPEKKYHPITIDDITKRVLKSSCLSLDSVVEKNTKIFLKNICNISQGGDIIDVSHKVHPSIKEHAKDITSFFQIPNLAFDVLTKDIQRPLRETGGVIIEVNPTPQWSGMYYVKEFDFIRDLLDSLFCE